jgi:hypothetical protein
VDVFVCESEKKQVMEVDLVDDVEKTNEAAVGYIVIQAVRPMAGAYR